jgi:hypothetical protein
MQATSRADAAICRSIIGDADNQARLRHSWATLTERLAKLAPEIERKQQAVSEATQRDRIG